MIISHKYKFIFIKTHKTAGTSVEVYLSRLCGKRDIATPFGREEPGHIARNYKDFISHMPAEAIRSEIPADIWDSYLKFAIERNPWDKTLSHYCFEKHRNFHGALGLDEYMQNRDFPINFPLYTDRAGRVMVDEFVRYEHLMEDLGGIFRRLGIPFDGSLHCRAKSGYRKDRRPYQKVFSEPQVEQIARAFSKEIRLHGYTYN